MILGVNLNHDYAYCVIDKNKIYLREAERISRIRHHWNESSYTLSILDDFTLGELKKIKAIYLNSPRMKDIEDKKGDLSSNKRNYTYIGDFIQQENKKGIAYGKILVAGIKINAAWVSHYHSHAASSFWASPYEKSDILCLDGGGDFGFGAWMSGNKYNISLKKRLLNIQFGLSYHFFSHKVFNTNDGFFESKVMAIASYGNRELSNNKYLKYDSSLDKESLKNTKISVHDIAKFQFQFEEGILDLIKKNENKENYLCCSGGCFLNVGLNQKIAESGMYKGVFIPPYTSDMGTSLGCALYACLDLEGKLPNKNSINTAFLGDSIDVSIADLHKIIIEAGDEPYNKVNI